MRFCLKALPNKINDIALTKCQRHSSNEKQTNVKCEKLFYFVCE